jgi:hypothetical protein
VQGYTSLMPGVTNGGGIGSIPGSSNDLANSVHGALATEAIYAIDGMNTATARANGGGNQTFFRIPQIYVSEVSVVVGGGTAEQPFGGAVTNVIPKEGGNTFSGSFYGEYSGRGLPAASNLTESLQAQGFSANGLARITRLWEVSPGIGGRILRDKLWFFSSYRHSGTIQTRPGMYDNLTPLGWAYTPDLNRVALGKNTDLSRNTRLTWQVSSKHKVSIFADAAPHLVWHRNYNAALSPEATGYAPYLPNALLMASWKSPITSRWLLDVGVTHNSSDLNIRRQTPETCLCSAPAVGFDVVSLVEATTQTQWRASSALVNPGGQHYGHFASHGFNYAASMSYITGSHAAKAGVQLRTGVEWISYESNGDRAYLLRNGVPSSIALYASPIRWQNEMRADLGLFVQDQWTYKRLTLTGGLRYDRYDGGGTAQHLDAGLWVPARDFPETHDSPQWTDLDPRMAAAYDLFGDGKTALKTTFGRFVAAQGANFSGFNSNHPVVRSVLSVTRTWNDANRDFNPDCDLRNQLANGECGQISDLNFGLSNPNATVYTDEVLHGLRNYNWETTAVVQRQLATGVSVTGGYYRRNFSNFLANDNQLVTPADYSHYCITAPVDSRLPGGGGHQICGLYDVSPALFGRNQTVVRSAKHYGTQTQVYDGFDLTENIRLRGGATISGGVSWGRTKTDTCMVIDSPGALQFCEVNPPFQPNASLVGFVPLPWWGLMTSATYRDYPGVQVTASYQVTNAQIAPSLGRNLSNGVNGTVNVQLIQPGTMYGPRQRELDLRMSKRFRFGRNRIMANLDIFNVFNTTGINTINTTYGPSWQRPTLLQLGRYVKLSGQFDF